METSQPASADAADEVTSPDPSETHIVCSGGLTLPPLQPVKENTDGE